MAEAIYPKIIKGLGWQVTVLADGVEVKGLMGSRSAQRGAYDRRRTRTSGRFSRKRVLLVASESSGSFELPLGPDQLAGTWIAALPDADEAEAREAAHALRQDDLYGLDLEERERNIRLWRIIGHVAVGLGVVLCAGAGLWEIFTDSTQPQLWLALAAYPGLMVVSGVASRGRLWITLSDKTTGSGVAVMMVLSLFALGFIAVSSPFHPWSRALTLAGALAAPLAALGWLAGQMTPPRRPRANYPLLCLACGALYGLVLYPPLDIALDFATPRDQLHLVQAVHRHNGRHTSYDADLLDLTGAGAEHVHLTSDQLYAIDFRGQPLMLRFHPGRLGAPWLEVLGPADRPQAAWWDWPRRAPAGGPPAIYTRADWLMQPPAAALAELYPARAAEAGLAGSAALSCAVSSFGGVHDCAVTAESPRGEGFGEAGQKIAKLMWMRPTQKNGLGVEGRVTVPLNFIPPTG